MFENSGDLTVSIAVCTYNPDSRLIARLLSALGRIIQRSPVREVVIVDNNSTVALSNQNIVNNFTKLYPIARIIVEETRGLSHARCRAIRETSGKMLIFFDDDNEPADNYVEVLRKYAERFPFVGVWGPGQIHVEFQNDPHPWLRSHKQIYQERHRQTGYSCLFPSENSFWVTGTGSAFQRVVLCSYEASVQSHLLNISGRTGNNLTSGEDIQMVWEAIKLGYAQGFIEELQCNHLISTSKANFAYLYRLCFGTSSSYYPALCQSFPELRKDLPKPRNPKLYIRMFLKIVLAKFVLQPHSAISAKVALVTALGDDIGILRVLGSSKLRIYMKISKFLKLV